MNDSKFKTIKKSLICNLTDKERQDYGVQLAMTLQDIDTLKTEAKSAAENLKHRMGGHQAKADDLGHKVRTGQEWRDVDCRVIYGQPTAKHKQTVRLDTGEVVGTEMMTETDLQLVMPLEEPAPPTDPNEEILKEFLALPHDDVDEFLFDLMSEGTAAEFVRIAVESNKLGQRRLIALARAVAESDGNGSLQSVLGHIAVASAADRLDAVAGQKRKADRAAALKELKDAPWTVLRAAAVILVTEGYVNLKWTEAEYHEIVDMTADVAARMDASTEDWERVDIPSDDTEGNY